jgi:hypothetical protein
MVGPPARRREMSQSVFAAVTPLHNVKRTEIYFLQFGRLASPIPGASICSLVRAFFAASSHDGKDTRAKKSEHCVLPWQKCRREQTFPLKLYFKGLKPIFYCFG